MNVTISLSLGSIVGAFRTNLSSTVMSPQLTAKPPTRTAYRPPNVPIGIVAWIVPLAGRSTPRYTDGVPTGQNAPAILISPLKLFWLDTVINWPGRTVVGGEIVQPGTSAVTSSVPQSAAKRPTLMAYCPLANDVGIVGVSVPFAGRLPRNIDGVPIGQKTPAI